MYKFAVLILFTLSSLISQGQRNEVSVSAIGNFNGGSFIHLDYGNGVPVAVTYRSSMGGAIEYRYWLTPRVGLGLWMEANPSEGELFTSSTNPYIFDISLTRYEFAVPVTERFWAKHKLQPYIMASPGFIVTHGSQPGWSQNFAITTGGGADYQLSPKWSVGIGLKMLDAKQGCYGDPTCVLSWSIAQDALLRTAYKW